MSAPLKEAVKHLLIVFAYSGTSAALPIALAWLQNDPRWVVLVPIINSIWYSISRYLKEKQSIEQGQGV